MLAACGCMTYLRTGESDLAGVWCGINIAARTIQFGISVNLAASSRYAAEDGSRVAVDCGVICGQRGPISGKVPDSFVMAIPCRPIGRAGWRIGAAAAPIDPEVVAGARQSRHLYPHIGVAVGIPAFDLVVQRRGLIGIREPQVGVGSGAKISVAEPTGHPVGKHDQRREIGQRSATRRIVAGEGELHSSRPAVVDSRRGDGVQRQYQHEQRPYDDQTGSFHRALLLLFLSPSVSEGDVPGIAKTRGGLRLIGHTIAASLFARKPLLVFAAAARFPASREWAVSSSSEGGGESGRRSSASVSFASA